MIKGLFSQQKELTEDERFFFNAEVKKKKKKISDEDIKFVLAITSH